MISSVEARWFMQGAVPPDTLGWIQRWKYSGREPEKRDDHYLDCPGISSIGIKLRDGKFEVKRRDLELGVVSFGSRATGRLALWRKWSLKVVGENAKTGLMDSGPL